MEGTAVNRQVIGGLYMLGSVFAFSCQLAFLKHASLALDPLQVLFLRNAMAAIFFAVAFAVTGPHRLRRGRIFTLRVGLGFLAGFFLLYANANAALAAVAIIFHARIFSLTGLAHLALGESVVMRRWLAMTTGFLGILLIVAPDRWDGWSLGLLAAVAAALLSSGSQIAVKALTADNAPLTIAAYTQLAFALLSAGPAYSVWRTLQMSELAVIAAGGISGGLAMLAAAKAFSLAPASVVSPVDNMGIFVSTLIGWAIFGETLSWNVAMGGLLISASSLYVAKRT